MCIRDREKQYQIDMLSDLHQSYESETKDGIQKIQLAAIQNDNIFEQLMDTCKYASLGQITQALFEVGGQYRRNM